MAHSGNSVCGEYGSTDYDEKVEPFTKTLTDTFEVKGFASFSFEVEFQLSRDEYGEESHEILSIAHVYDSEGDETTVDKAFIAGLSGQDIDMRIQKFHYDRHDRYGR